jgi:hypothetical protein
MVDDERINVLGTPELAPIVYILLVRIDALG